MSDKVSRRDFLKASVTAGLTLATGKYFLNRNPVPKKTGALTVPSFTVPNTAGRFCLVKGENPAKLVRKAVEGIGGISQYIGRGQKVLLKVNCAFARPAWMGATTSPEVTAEMVRLCYEAGASAVRVTDNPISDPKSCFLTSGLSRAVKDAGGEIMLPNPSDFQLVKVSDGVIGNWEVFYTPLKWCDKLIGLPTAKTHNLCAASLAMKNWYGFIGGSRSRFHQNIHQVIAELGRFITPTFVILDGTRMMIHNGPTGGSDQDVTAGNFIVASTDQVAADACGVHMLGLEQKDVPYIGLAREKGLGNPEYRKLPGFKEVTI
jgi:uncharacterized protein (DUF362 family)